VVNDAASQLLACPMGQSGDGSWGVGDSDSVSDANLWLGYSLAEAAHLWGEARCLGRRETLMERIPPKKWQKSQKSA